jgi:hypothetical protein
MTYALFDQAIYAPSSLPYIAIAAVAGTSALVYLRYRRGRSDALRFLAAKQGLEWFGNMLPSEFPRKLLDELYSGWVMPRWTSPHNVVGGNVGTDFLLAFDIAVAKGESCYQRTIVARRSAGVKAKSSFIKGYVCRCCGEWHLATLESSVMVLPRIIEPGAIEKLWEQLR